MGTPEPWLSPLCTQPSSRSAEQVCVGQTAIFNSEVFGLYLMNIERETKKKKKMYLMDGEAYTRASWNTVRESDFGTTVRIIGLCMYSQGLEVLDGLLGKKRLVFSRLEV